MKKLQSFFLLIAFTLISVSCENSNHTFELERDSNISEMISFKMTLRNNFSSLNRTLRQENWKLGNLDDMQYLYKSQNIYFQNGFNLGLNLFVENQENARTFSDSFSVSKEQMSFIEEVIDGAFNFQDPSNYIGF